MSIISKTLIAAALMLAVSAQASVTIATSPNTAGGELRLTDAQGECPKDWRVIISTSSGGSFLVGCWTIADDKVFVVYSDGSERLYRSEGFKVLPRAKKGGGA